MRVFRLQKQRYVATFLDGEGSRRTGGRWNPAGTPLLYTSTTPELAMLEVMVHTDGTPLRDMPPLVQVELEIPDLVEIIAEEELPAGWDQIVAPNGLAQFLLPRLQPNYPVLAFSVPSVVMKHTPSRNILLNPQHPLMQQVQIVQIIDHLFDERL